MQYFSLFNLPNVQTIDDAGPIITFFVVNSDSDSYENENPFNYALCVDMWRAGTLADRYHTSMDRVHKYVRFMSSFPGNEIVGERHFVLPKNKLTEDVVIFENVLNPDMLINTTHRDIKMKLTNVNANKTVLILNILLNDDTEYSQGIKIEDGKIILLSSDSLNAVMSNIIEYNISSVTCDTKLEDMRDLRGVPINLAIFKSRDDSEIVLANSIMEKYNSVTTLSNVLSANNLQKQDWSIPYWDICDEVFIKRGDSIQSEFKKYTDTYFESDIRYKGNNIPYIDRVVSAIEDTYLEPVLEEAPV